MRDRRSASRAAHRFFSVRAMLLLALASHAAPAAAAQSHSTGSGHGYPARPVRLVVPFAPGGGNDFLARLVGQKLGEPMGPPFGNGNRAGGGGNIPTDLVAKSAPDGY